MEIFWTVFSGVCVYTIGQLINNFWILPIRSQKETIGKISDALIFYANIYTSPVGKGEEIDRKEERNEASQVFRNLACEIISRMYQVPGYKFLSYLGFVSSIETIQDSHSALIGLSNTTTPSYEDLDFTHKMSEKLKANLRLI